MVVLRVSRFSTIVRATTGVVAATLPNKLEVPDAACARRSACSSRKERGKGQAGHQSGLARWVAMITKLTLTGQPSVVDLCQFSAALRIHNGV
jgi:hypothetical protein